MKSDYSRNHTVFISIKQSNNMLYIILLKQYSIFTTVNTDYCIIKTSNIIADRVIKKYRIHVSFMFKLNDVPSTTFLCRF